MVGIPSATTAGGRAIYSGPLERSKGSERGSLLRLMAADALLRSCYQVGKTPLLPIFALSLGAGPALVGVIASVSTATGIVVKPLVGAFADQQSSRRWIRIGLVLFIGPALLYQFVSTPMQLVALRSVHGLATAVFGPATLTYLAKWGREGLAQRLGTFGVARAIGYVVGPLAGGLSLMMLEPGETYAVLGLLSALAVLPLLGLSPAPETITTNPTWRWREARSGLRAAWSSRAVWISGLLEGGIYIVLNGLKIFLPIHIVAVGHSLAWAGTVLAVQVLLDVMLRPFGGRLGDRIGYRTSISLGLSLLATALLLLPLGSALPLLLACGAGFGVAQAIVFPNAMAFALSCSPEGKPHAGAAIGTISAFQSAGKVAGPILSGILIQAFGFGLSLQMLALVVIFAALFIRGSGSRYFPTGGRPRKSNRDV